MNHLLICKKFPSKKWAKASLLLPNFSFLFQNFSFLSAGFPPFPEEEFLHFAGPKTALQAPRFLLWNNAKKRLISFFIIYGEIGRFCAPAEAPSKVALRLGFPLFFESPLEKTSRTKEWFVPLHWILYKHSLKIRFGYSFHALFHRLLRFVARKGTPNRFSFRISPAGILRCKTACFFYI